MVKFGSLVVEMRIDCRHSSLILFNTLRTSGFVDDVMASYNGPYMVRHVSSFLSENVCLSFVCLLAYLENHTADLCQIFTHVACGHGLVLL